MAFPFASSYGPVDALATRQMQINAVEQARQLEMQRMAQVERQTQVAAMLQQKQLQDAQASRELQAALSFRQQAAVEAQNRAVMEDATATRAAQLGWNEKDLAARERMQGEQLKAAREIALIPRYDSKLEGVRLDRDIEEDAKRTKAIGAAARANAALDLAVEKDVLKDEASFWTPHGVDLARAREYIANPNNQKDILKRRNKLKTSLTAELPADALGVLKWNEANFQWEPAFESEGKSSGAPTAKADRPAGLSSVGPFDDFRVTFDTPTMPDPPATPGPVIVAPRMQVPSAPTARQPVSPFIFNASPYGIGGMTAPGPSIPQRKADDTVYRPTNRAEYEAVPNGARFVNPSDGKTYTKKSSAK